MGLSQGSFNVGVAGIALLVIMDILAFNGVEIRDRIIRQSIWYRWIIMIAGILSVLIFGIWGAGYNASSFIYQQF